MGRVYPLFSHLVHSRLHDAVPEGSSAAVLHASDSLESHKPPRPPFVRTVPGLFLTKSRWLIYRRSQVPLTIEFAFLPPSDVLLNENIPPPTFQSSYPDQIYPQR